ncbi:MAG: hypothetical protein DIU68_001815 [Chloroflexota bacterium]|nr:MAG: hypothetical protein DIU68_06665 [Chloroflexota bacterium]
MSTDRSARTLVAAILIIVALFLAMNYLIDSRPVADWWLPLVLLIAGLLVTQYGRIRREEEVVTSEGGPVVYSVREYTLPGQATPPAVTGPEQAGEVNVDEPRDEVESEPVVEAPETMTPPAEPVETETPEPEPVVPAPETQTPPAETPEEDAERRAVEDFETAGEFAPPSSIEGALNPPTESDSVPGAVVQHETPVQERDPAAHETPLTRITEPQTPPRTQAERLEKDQEILQPADTAENEFQSGEHVAANQPTRSTPPETQTTGEGMGPGVEPVSPQEKAVLDTTAAPAQPQDKQGVDPTQPEVADAVLSGEESEATAEGLASSETVRTTPASDAVVGASARDDLTVIVGIGSKMQEALNAAGITTFAQLAASTDDDLRAAIEAAGMRLAPTLPTWRQQANFLARGDRAGFEALVNALRSGEGENEDENAE